MYKTKLQELCHRRSWNLPEYSTCREGPDHNPRFQATVTVENLSFQSQNFSRSSKEAQNDAAHVAFLYFSSSSGPNAASLLSNISSKPKIEQKRIEVDPIVQFSGSSPPIEDDSGSKGTPNAASELTNLSSKPKIEQKRKEMDRISQFSGSAPPIKDDNGSKGIHHLYKNQLQTYTQKQNLCLPAYSCEREGPPHACHFRCKVTVGEQTFESQEFFPTLKEAEHAVAEIALTSLLPNATQEVDCIVYKNRLQELAQKEGHLLPFYTTVRSGEAHMPTFLSTVEVVGKVFKGNEAKTKKQAEFSAAKVAYLSLTDGNLVQVATSLPPSSRTPRVVDHSASSKMCDNRQQESRHKRRLILNPDSAPKEEVDGNEAPCVLDQSHDADGSKKCDPSSSSPPKSFKNWVKDVNIDAPAGTAASASSLDQCPRETDASSISKPIAVTGASSSRHRIVVRPWLPNMTFPSGSEVVVSDDNWVALKLGAQSNP